MSEEKGGAVRVEPFGKDTQPPPGFPATFYYANAIELFERLAHYGLYIGLSLYLTNIVHMGDKEVGSTLGNWRLVASLAPIPCGAIADRITFKRSLVVAFLGYSLAYAGILLFPIRSVAIPSLFLAAIAGGFMKPVIMGTVVRTSPPGRQTEGFGVFYRMINAGSVVGKIIAYGVRRFVALRFVSTTSVIASVIALGIAVFAYEEPKDGGAEKGPALKDTLKGYATALRDVRFASFLLIFAGFYFMAEQFYMTFPKYVTRHIDEKAPLEIITLVNPFLIATCQGWVTRALKKIDSVKTMAIGVAIGACSMLVMGAIPNLAGALLSGAIFAFAEMTFSHRYYDQIATFAPKGKAGMYMGLAFVPSAIGAWVGGQASGRLIERYMPATGPRAPLTIWSIYAGLGILCAIAMVVYGVVTRVEKQIDEGGKAG
ncbi:MAG: MFS transporter [Deltaproteobacteria bacterium]|nr:MFS transporter [Deltaproteobacteria bacterium]